MAMLTQTRWTDPGYALAEWRRLQAAIEWPTTDLHEIAKSVYRVEYIDGTLILWLPESCRRIATNQNTARIARGLGEYASQSLFNLAAVPLPSITGLSFAIEDTPKDAPKPATDDAQLPDITKHFKKRSKTPDAWI